MSSYNLTNNLQTSFDFAATIDGKENKYIVKYPSQKELEPISRGYARIREIDKEYSKLSSEGDALKKKSLEEETEEVSKNITAAFEDLFAPQEGSMPITDLLERLPINARRNFNKMIQTEFNTEAE